MILYHGSNMSIEKPILIPNQRALDFGQGFYLTSDFEQAKRWANVVKKRTGEGIPTITVFEINDIVLKELNVLEFECPNKEWLRLIAKNRNGEEIKNEYDLIIGPVANDNTMPVINLYLEGNYNEDEALKRLLPQNLKDQFTFKTDYALSKLVLKEIIIDEE